MTGFAEMKTLGPHEARVLSIHESLVAEIAQIAETVANVLRQSASERAATELTPAVARLGQIGHELGRMSPRIHASDTPSQNAHSPLVLLATLPKICRLIEAQIDPAHLPLYPPPPVTDPRQSVLSGISNHTVSALERSANPHDQSPDALDASCYGDIRLSHAEFITHIHAAYRVLLAQRKPTPFRFIDIGCGGGGKVLTARAVFDEAHGLELDETYADAAQTLLESEGAVLKGDALTFTGYNTFDVIYFFQPIQDNEKLVELERRIVDQSRRGTLLIAAYEHFKNRSENYDVCHIAERLFITKTSKAETARLLTEAERTGVFIRRPGLAGAPQKIWHPILQASWANGFELA